MSATPRPLVLPVLGALMAGLLVASPAGAGHPGARPPAAKHGPTLEVLTQNLYLGSSLDPALEATTGAEFIAATAQIYGTAVASDPERRLGAVADTIASTRPDLVGLQEVSRWTAVPLATGANPPSFDFLALLLAELAERGLSYRVAGVADNADIGPVPLVAPAFGCRTVTSPTSFDCAVALQDRDVILENTRTPELRLGAAVAGRYAAQQSVPIPDAGGATLDFGRGWVQVDGTLRGAPFRFLNTHLEVGEFAAVQQAQAQELLAGPGRTRRPLVLTGDFNSAADGSSTTTYADLIGAGLLDAWGIRRRAPGFTCCQAGDLANRRSTLRTRIDLVLTRGIRRVRWATVVGDRPIAKTPPRWASDHAGVVAEVQLHAGRGHGPGHHGPGHR